MKINNFTYNQNIIKNSQTFSGTNQRAGYNFDASLIKPGERTYPRTFSYDTYSAMMAHPDLLSDRANGNIAFNILKDIRKSQEESDIYLPMAKRFQTLYKRAIEEDKNKKQEFYENGMPVREFIDYGEVNKNGEKITYGCEYRDDGVVFCMGKFVDGIPAKAVYGRPFKTNGKTNCVNFNKDGSVKDIRIGVKRNFDGTMTTDKIFSYGENNKLKEGALDVVKKPDGTVEMKNYFRLNPACPDFIDKYAGKKTIRQDGSVLYEGLLYFREKHFHKYIPRIIFEKEEDNNKLVDNMIKSGNFVV